MKIMPDKIFVGFIIDWISDRIDLRVIKAELSIGRSVFVFKLIILGFGVAVQMRWITEDMREMMASFKEFEADIQEKVKDKEKAGMSHDEALAETLGESTREVVREKLIEMDDEDV